MKHRQSLGALENLGVTTDLELSCSREKHWTLHLQAPGLVIF